MTGGRSARRHRGTRILMGLTLAAACGGLAEIADAQEHGAPRGWPEADPHVALERVIAKRGDLGRGRLLRALAGLPDTALFDRPYGACWDGDDLVVGDPGAGHVLRLRPGGRSKATEDGLFESPTGIACCSEGVVAADSRAGRVGVLDAHMRVARWLLTDLVRPTAVACEGDRIYVSETGRHRILVVEGDALLAILGERGAGPGQFNFPTALAVDRSSLWVGDTLNFRLQRLNRSAGEYAGEFGRLGSASGEIARLKDVEIDAGGNLWVSDAHHDEVAVYRPDGVFLMSLGGSGDAPGQFSFPAGIAAHPDGRVAVVDSFNRRIQVFRLLDRRQDGGG